MNKKLFTKILVFIFIISTILILFLLIYIGNKKTGNNEYLTNTGEISEINTEPTKEDINSKIDNLKKKISLKGIIEKGDLYFDTEEYAIALTKYLQILKEIPDDEETINKVGNVYFELKKYNKAYEYYSKIKDYINLDKKKTIYSLFFSYINKLSQENTNYISSEIDKYNLNEDENFYYKNSLLCIDDFSLCKLRFQEYFKLNVPDNLSESGSLSFSGTIEEEKQNSDLENIKEALINYENFKLDDLSYKGALVSGAFFSNGLYPIAIETSKNILFDKPDYKPILKILAKSYYELGLYEFSKDFLIQYSKIDDNDPEINYFIGVIYQKLHDYVLSSIHLKKSIMLGYSNSIEARRRIIFNYSEVGEIDKMLKSFEDLINEEKDNLKIDDFNLAIYFHIINSKFEKAKKLINIGLEKFDDKSIFYAYLGWINLEENSINNGTGSLDSAEKNLNMSYEINKNNSMINYLLGVFELKKQNKSKAVVYLKNAVILDEKGEFGIKANNTLESLK